MYLSQLNIKCVKIIFTVILTIIVCLQTVTILDFIFNYDVYVFPLDGYGILYSSSRIYFAYHFSIFILISLLYYIALKQKDPKIIVMISFICILLFFGNLLI